jgi:hypothetical protein
MSKNVDLIIYNGDNVICEFHKELNNYKTLLTNFFEENNKQTITLEYFNEFLAFIEKLYLQKSIYNLIHNKKEEDDNIYELTNKYHLFFEENQYLYNIYLDLLTLFIGGYQVEEDKFIEKKNKYLDTYTGEIEYESENFEPYEYLHFQNSKCFKKYYEKNIKILDNILKNIKDNFDLDDIFNNYIDIFEKVSQLAEYMPEKKYKIKIQI